MTLRAARRCWHVWLACALALTGCADTGGKQGALRVMSWNLARGHGLEPPVVGNGLPARWTALGALRDDPRVQVTDVLALQEVCGDQGARDVGRVAAAFDTPHVFFHRADVDREGACREGQAVVSRWPIVAAGTLVLPALKPMRKTAVWVEIAVPGVTGERRVRLWNVHLDHAADSGDAPARRRDQLAPVLAEIQALRALDPDRAVVLTGDFNTLEGDEPVVADASHTLAPAFPTAEATHVLGWKLDHLFFAGLLRRHAQVVTLPGSDHFALLADFDLAPASAAHPPASPPRP